MYTQLVVAACGLICFHRYGHVHKCELIVIYSELNPTSLIGKTCKKNSKCKYLMHASTGADITMDAEIV